MLAVNIDGIVGAVKNCVRTHALEERGQYARFLWQNEWNTRELGVNEYGCADAVNILYTLNDFISDPDSRTDHIRALQNLQHKDTGFFEEHTHHVIHTTAHCIAALELLDARPLYPVYALKEHFTAAGIRLFLDGLNWENGPWQASHQGAGIYVCGKLTDAGDSAWEKAYFDWLWNNTDPDSGFWMKNGTGDTTPLYQHMAGSFHYFFNHE